MYYHRRILPLLASTMLGAALIVAGPAMLPAHAGASSSADDPFADIDLGAIKKAAPQEPSVTTDTTGDTTTETPVPDGEPPAAAAIVLFDNNNIYAVDNHPFRATVFGLSSPAHITRIVTYHWNYGRGRAPGNIRLRDQNGRVFGPWQAWGTEGQGGVPNAYWTVTPELVLPAGNYRIVDSNPATWAQNPGTGGAGFATVEGIPEMP